ncbi:MAG: FeoB-associated Cys-rich membrane protein [Pirellulales bacterium]
MISNSQDMIVLIAVAAAASYLAVRGWRRVFRASAGGCGACSHCAPAEANGTTTNIRGFVSSDQIVMTSAQARPNRGGPADGH